MAFANELEASSCKTCSGLFANQNCLVRKLPCGHMYVQSLENTFKGCGGGSEDRVSCEKKLLDVGFWGGTGGRGWDDGFFDGVRAISVRYGHCIDSIQVTYDRVGASIEGAKHGGSKGVSSAVIDLDYPAEYIECVSGHVSVVENNWLVVRSLTFETNKRTFGPYGKTVGLPFTFPLIGLRIVGFKGRSEGYLDAIGFHVSKHASPVVRGMGVPVSSIREMLEELLVSSRRLLNIVDDNGGAYAAPEF